MLDKSELVGKFIKKVYITEDNTKLILENEHGVHFALVTEGTCCNEVYFNHINGIENLIDSYIVKVEYDKWEDLGAEEDYEVTEMQTMKITSRKETTALGICELEVRNDCRSWAYAGSIEEETDPTFIIEDLKELTKDF